MSISSDEVAATTRFYEPELDALRFLACVSVYLCHALPTDTGMYSTKEWNLYGYIISWTAHVLSMGLPLFFFLSAYLIARLLMTEHGAFGALHIKRFLTRRALRIWPLYYISVVFALLYAIYINNDEHILSLLYFSLFLGNWYNIFHGWTSNIIGPLWSISVEEQFYIILPVCLRIFGVDRIVKLALSFMIFGLMAIFILGLLEVPYHYIRLNTISNFVFFGSGMLCAKLKTRISVRLPIPGRFMALALSLISFYISARLSNFGTPDIIVHAERQMFGFCFSSIGCISIFICFTETSAKIPQCILYMGKLSYGIYAVHWPILELTDYVIGDASPWWRLTSAIPTVLIALLSYRYIETPFLKLRSKFTFIPSGAPGLA